jgi:hypothetical protein
MAMNCDIIVQWSATPEQLSALGSALWRWCNGPARGSDVYQSLNNQPLADLISGKMPTSHQMPQQVDQRGVHFRFRTEASPDRQTTIDSLRRHLPTGGVAGILVDGTSPEAGRAIGPTIERRQP